MCVLLFRWLSKKKKKNRRTGVDWQSSGTIACSSVLCNWQFDRCVRNLNFFFRASRRESVINSYNVLISSSSKKKRALRHCAKGGLCGRRVRVSAPSLLKCIFLFFSFEKKRKMVTVIQ